MMFDLRWIAALVGVFSFVSLSRAGIVGVDGRGGADLASIAGDQVLQKSKAVTSLDNVDLLIMNTGAVDDLPAPWTGGHASLKSHLTFDNQLEEMSAHLSCSAAGDGGTVIAGSSLAIAFEVTDSLVHFHFRGSMSGSDAGLAHVRINDLAAEDGRLFFKGIDGASRLSFLDEGSLKPGFYQFTLFSRVDGNSIPVGSFARLDATLKLSPATAIPLSPAVVPGAILLIAMIAGRMARIIPPDQSPPRFA